MKWDEFAAAVPGLAEFGLQRFATGLAYLATIRADGSPRVHPVSPFIGRGRLFVYMEPTSPKGRDLQRDGRYAMHCSVEDINGGAGEFCIRGEARLIDDPEMRDRAFEAARAVGRNPNDRYILFELSVEEALSTIYVNDQPARHKWSDNN